MSRLVARILLTIMMFPLASLVYLVIFVAAVKVRFSETSFLLAGTVSWLFIAGYWLPMWRQSVRWTQERKRNTALAAIFGLLGGVIAGAILWPIDEDLGALVGSAAAPVLWLLGTVFAWRETPTERAQRLRSSGAESITCPICGYNLTGLSEARCPECGSRFTLDELFASQPARATQEIDR